MRCFIKVVVLNLLVLSTAFAAKEPLVVSFYQVPAECTVTKNQLSCDGYVGRTYTFEYLIKNNLSITSPVDVAGFITPLVRDTTIANNCPAKLAANASCILKYTLSVSKITTVSQVLLITNGGKIQDFPLSMTLKILG
tara:strand:+ start:117738 stop:118151 length:414 start_codon:yes stop_codon:yes gene_type:complete